MSEDSLKCIFMSEKMREQVKEVEQSMCSTAYSTLLDAFIIPDKGKDYDPKIIQKAKMDFITNVDPQYNEYGLDYDIKATNSYMKNRKALMEISSVKKILNDESPNVRDVEIASLNALKPMQAYAFKLLVLSKKGMKKNYWGMMPNTSHVRKAAEFLFDESGNNQWRHTVFCFKLAKELKTYPLYINTVMYILGQKL
jgi:hypothetical protein